MHGVLLRADVVGGTRMLEQLLWAKSRPDSWVQAHKMPLKRSHYLSKVSLQDLISPVVSAFD